MAERLKALWQKILDWWNQFTAKQKTLIVGAGAVVLITIIILVTALNQPQYVLLAHATSTKEASQIKELLDSNSIGYKISDDGLDFKVLKKNEVDGRLLLGANDIQAYGYSIENVTESSFSTTESDKQKKYVKYLESTLEHDTLQKFDAIESAVVKLHIPDNDGTLIGNKDEASASIALDIKDGADFNEDNAAFIAKFAELECFASVAFVALVALVAKPAQVAFNAPTAQVAVPARDALRAWFAIPALLE